MLFLFCIPALLNIKVEDSKNLRNLILPSSFLFFILFVVSSWFETIRELVVMLTIPLGIQEFKPHALYGLRASGDNHKPFFFHVAFCLHYQRGLQAKIINDIMITKVLLKSDSIN